MVPVTVKGAVLGYMVTEYQQCVKSLEYILQGRGPDTASAILDTWAASGNK